MAKSGSTTVSVSSITVPETRSRLLGDFKELAKSIAEVGLLQPIVVTKDHLLVAGLHRLRACESLGWTEIPVVVVEVEGLRAELAEIDENLIRNELTKLERGEHLAKRKRIYEFLHPETKAGVAGAVAKHDKAATEMISFADDTASKTGLSARTVQHEVQIAEKIAPEVKEAIRGTPLADSKVKLLEIARLPAEEQAEAAARRQRERKKEDAQWERRKKDRKEARAAYAACTKENVAKMIRDRRVAGLARVLVTNLASSDVRRLLKEIVELAPYAKGDAT